MAFFTRVYAVILGATLAFTMSAVAQDRMTQAQYDALMAAPAKPLDLTVVASKKRVARKVIGPEGGAITLATYQNRAVGDAFQFEVPETGEHPIVGRTVDLGRAERAGSLISGSVDSTILIRHLPPKIKNGDWEISKLR